ncbi:MAG: Abi-alpha family protein [Pseudonocardia sp.]
MATEDASPPAGLAHRAGALAGGAFAVARWAARAYVDVARKLPGAATVEAEWRRVERSVLVELRRRLDNADPLGHPAPGPPATLPGSGAARSDEPRVPVDGASVPVTGPPPRETEPLRAAMAELLLRSMEQTAQRAREYLYLAVVRQLLPDEARILAALADGSAYPVVHVERRTGVAGGDRLLSNASTVGRAAGVAQLRDVPRYLARLRALELVELGEPDPALSVPYDILLTDPDVRAAERAARDGGRVRIVRRTVRLSPLGRALWEACHPRDTLDASWFAAELEPVESAGPPAPPPAGPVAPSPADGARNGTGPVSRSEPPQP